MRQEAVRARLVADFCRSLLRRPDRFEALPCGWRVDPPTAMSGPCETAVRRRGRWLRAPKLRGRVTTATGYVYHVGFSCRP
jgi:hypothetical protein